MVSKHSPYHLPCRIWPISDQDLKEWNHCASRITSHRNQHVQHDLTQSTQSNTIPSHHNPHNTTPLHYTPTTLKSPFVCSGGRGVNPARERVPPCNPAGIPCTQRHDARLQRHAHHDTRYYTATHSTMSAAILRTATHTERNSHTAHDRPSQACTYSKRPTHQGATTVELLLCDCVTTPHAASRKPFHPGRRMTIHANVTVTSCDTDLSHRALYDGTYTRIDLHTASQDNRCQAAKLHTFTACISWMHVYTRAIAYSQIAHNTPNTRLYITPGSLEITGFATHKNSRLRKLNPIFILEAAKPVIARVPGLVYRCLFEGISRFTGWYIPIFMQSCYNKSSVEVRTKTEKTGQALQRQTGPSHKATRYLLETNADIVPCKA